MVALIVFFNMGHYQTQKVLHAHTDRDNNDKANFLFNTGHTQTQNVLQAQMDRENNDKASFLSNTGHTQSQKGPACTD